MNVAGAMDLPRGSRWIANSITEPDEHFHCADAQEIVRSGL